MRKIAILGASSPSKWWADDLDETWELWSMNLCHQFLQRPAQRWFQMHHRMHNSENGHPPGHFGRPLSHEEWLSTCGIPVYMQDVDPAIPTSVRYPREDVLKQFGNYFTSSAAYMLGLALHEGVDELQVLGIYMNAGTEYSHQRPCLEYLLGAARAMGVRVVLPPGCDLATAPLYAYNEFEEPLETLALESVEIVIG